jgi:hypothetical protein
MGEAGAGDVDVFGFALYAEEQTLFEDGGGSG